MCNPTNPTTLPFENKHYNSIATETILIIMCIFTVMQSMMDVFSKMVGNVVAQQQQSTKTTNDEPQHPTKPKNVEPQPPTPVTSAVNTVPNQPTGAIKKDVIPGNY